MSYAMAHELSLHERLREQLVSECPTIDEETLADTLEGLTDLNEILGAFVRSYLDDIALTAALKSRVMDMQDRLSRISKRSDKKRALVTSVMERAGLKKLAEPDFTVSLRPSRPPLLVDDETAIPAAFWNPQPPKLDRQALIGALSAGQGVPGAVLGNAPMTIAIRTK